MSEFVSSEIAHKLKEKGFPLLRVIKQRGEPIIYDLPKNHPNWQENLRYIKVSKKNGIISMVERPIYDD